MRTQIVSQLRRVPQARAAVVRYRQSRRQLAETSTALGYLRGSRPFADLPDEVAVRLAFNILLRREPDEVGAATFGRWLAEGMTMRDVVTAIRSSDEFAAFMAYKDLGPSIHHGRGIFVRSLPPARRILDLGGSSTIDAKGAFVLFDYPYAFEELVIVELPADERHELYRAVQEGDVVETHLGPVRYRYHSMVELGGFGDAAFDLVYSGQTIEHVTPNEADRMLGEIHRVLRPGGWFAFDTPNAAVCRLHQDDFIDPDHKVEYTDAEITAKVTAAGLDVVRRHGLNWAGASMAAREFFLEETARRWGLYDDVENSYILCYVCRKPA